MWRWDYDSLHMNGEMHGWPSETHTYIIELQNFHLTPETSYASLRTAGFPQALWHGLRVWGLSFVQTQVGAAIFLSCHTGQDGLHSGSRASSCFIFTVGLSLICKLQRGEPSPLAHACTRKVLNKEPFLSAGCPSCKVYIYFLSEKYRGWSRDILHKVNR